MVNQLELIRKKENLTSCWVAQVGSKGESQMITKRVDTEGNKVKLTRLKLCSHFSEGVVGAQGDP